ncbi:hypothetical protein ATCC90586_008116 [Pythium insidiosum]|nr:hypothetical protein ATCC90586_008116 [Pythium insidiosum]
MMDQPKIKLNLAMKRFIREKVLLKLKASRILNAMIDARVIYVDAEPFLRPVQRYAYAYRTSGLDDTNNVDEMERCIAFRFNMQQRQDQSLRREFYTLCKEHLASRAGGGYITTQAFRRLLKHVKAYMFSFRCFSATSKRSFARPLRCVRDGDEFKYSELLDERIINGEPNMLVKWEPTWEPTWEPLANIRKRDLKEYHDKNRKKRRLARSNVD